MKRVIFNSDPNTTIHCSDCRSVGIYVFSTTGGMEREVWKLQRVDLGFGGEKWAWICMSHAFGMWNGTIDGFEATLESVKSEEVFYLGSLAELGEFIARESKR